MTEEVEVSAAVAPPLRAMRKSVPVAPRLIHDASQAAVERIRAALQSGLFQDHADAPYAAAQAVKAIPTINLHPHVAHYKSEVLDYLEGKMH